MQVPNPFEQSEIKRKNSLKPTEMGELYIYLKQKVYNVINELSDISNGQEYVLKK